MNKISKVMEMFWLILGFVTLGAVIYLVFQNSLDEVKMYFIFPAICFAMFFFRRFMRNKITQMEEEREQMRNK